MIEIYDTKILWPSFPMGLSDKIKDTQLNLKFSKQQWHFLVQVCPKYHMEYLNRKPVWHSFQN